MGPRWALLQLRLESAGFSSAAALRGWEAVLAVSWAAWFSSMWPFQEDSLGFLTQ